MKDRGIICSQVHNRNDKHSCVSFYKRELPQLDKLEQSIICIPCGWWISADDAEKIVESIKEWCIKKRPLIRSIIDSDYTQYLSLLYQLNHQNWNTYTKDQFEHKLILLESMNNHIYVAVDEASGKIVGTVKLLVESKFFDPIGHLEDVVVDTEHRGMNIGKELVQYATRIAFDEYKCYKVVLNANASLTEFYNKCNYQIDENNISYTHRFHIIKQ